MRDKPYAGPNDTNDFNNPSPDAMAKAMHEYQLLGECIETLTDDDMMGRGRAIDSPLILVEGHADNLRRAQRELSAAVALDMSVNDARSAYDLRP